MRIEPCEHAATNSQKVLSIRASKGVYRLPARRSGFTPCSKRFMFSNAIATDLRIMTRPDLLQDVIEIAKESGRAILEVYATSFNISSKADSSPVTEADERAERLILEKLRP